MQLAISEVSDCNGTTVIGGVQGYKRIAVQTDVVVGNDRTISRASIAEVYDGRAVPVAERFVGGRGRPAGTKLTDSD